MKSLDEIYKMYTYTYTYASFGHFCTFWIQSENHANGFSEASALNSKSQLNFVKYFRIFVDLFSTLSHWIFCKCCPLFTNFDGNFGGFQHFSSLFLFLFLLLFLFNNSYDTDQNILIDYQFSWDFAKRIFRKGCSKNWKNVRSEHSVLTSS